MFFGVDRNKILWHCYLLMPDFTGLSLNSEQERSCLSITSEHLQWWGRASAPTWLSQIGLSRRSPAWELPPPPPDAVPGAFSPAPWPRLRFQVLCKSLGGQGIRNAHTNTRIIEITTVSKKIAVRRYGMREGAAFCSKLPAASAG